MAVLRRNRCLTPSTPARGELVKYNVRVGDDLHEWLRTTAFHARTSINALVVAALTRAHAVHPTREGAVGAPPDAAPPGRPRILRLSRSTMPQEMTDD